MTFFGRVSKGAITLPPDSRLPEGTEVRIETIAPKGGSNRKEKAAALRKLAASIEGLPADLAKNHDHYLFGTPRK
jgi:hypothetical protein